MCIYNTKKIHSTIVYVQKILFCLYMYIPNRNSETPTITGSNWSPALLATHCTPKARNPARVVPHILFRVLYIVAPAI